MKIDSNGDIIVTTVVSGDGVLKRLNVKTLAEIDSRTFSGEACRGIACDDDYIYVSGNSIYRLNKDFTTDGSTAVSGDYPYDVDTSGNIYCVSHGTQRSSSYDSSLTLRWTNTTDGNTADIRCAKDGSVLYLLTDGATGDMLHTLNPSTGASTNSVNPNWASINRHFDIDSSNNVYVGHYATPDVVRKYNSSLSLQDTYTGTTFEVINAVGLDANDNIIIGGSATGGDELRKIQSDMATDVWDIPLTDLTNVLHIEARYRLA